jgi:hypothetical protein
MRALAPLALCLACAACAQPGSGAPPAAPRNDAPPAPAPQEVAPRTLTFAHRADDATTVTLEERYGVDVVVRAQRADGVGRTDDLVIESRDEVRFETLAPDSSPEPSYRVVFGPVYETRIHRGQQTQKDLPMNGKTYRVALRGHTAFITDDRGGHIPKDEGRTLARRFAGYDAARATMARFVEKPIRIGARSEEIESILRQSFTKGVDDVDVGDVTATLLEERDIDGVPCGGFDVSAHVVFRNAEGWTFVNDLHGKVYVRTTDAVFARTDLSGPVQLAGAIQGVTIQAEGHATFHTAHKSM